MRRDRPTVTAGCERVPWTREREAMKLFFRCPGCNQKYRCDENWRGRRARCLRCRTVMRLPPGAEWISRMTYRSKN